MPFPFPDNDDYLDQFADPEPEAPERCRHGVLTSVRCEDCDEAAEERQSPFADAEWPFAENF